jgi:hypothetical protein
MDKLLNTPITCDIELGTNTPCHSLSNVIVQGNDNSELIYIDGAFDGGSPIYLGLTKSRGNKQNKLPVEAGDVLGGFQVYGRIKAGNSVGYDHLETPLCGSVMFKVGDEYKFGDESIPTELMIVVGNEKSLEIKVVVDSKGNLKIAGNIETGNLIITDEPASPSSSNPSKYIKIIYQGTNYALPLYQI